MVGAIELTTRQELIIEIVKREGPITGEKIAVKLSLTRATLRPDLAILTMSGILEARPKVGYFYSGKANKSVFASRMEKLKVKDVQSRPVVVSEQCSVYDAVVTIFTEDVGTLFVVQDNKLEGLVSRKDLLKITLGGIDAHKIPVGIIMTRMPNIITVREDESVVEATKKLILHEIDSMPVVRVATQDSGEQFMEVLGRFTKTNVARLFMELLEE